MHRHCQCLSSGGQLWIWITHFATSLRARAGWRTRSLASCVCLSLSTFPCSWSWDFARFSCLKFRIAGHGPVFISRPGGPCPSESSYTEKIYPEESSHVSNRDRIIKTFQAVIKAYNSVIILLKFQVTTFERLGDSFLGGKSLSDSEILTMFSLPDRTDWRRMAWAKMQVVII